MIKICTKCSKEFITDDKRQKYCCIVCAYADRPNKKVLVMCDYCKNELKIFPSRSIIKHHFCNVSCQIEWQKVYHSGTNNPQWKGATLAKVCEYCRRTFKPRRKDAQFCCDYCRISDLTEWQYGSDNPAWKGGTTTGRRVLEMQGIYKAWKRKVFERDKYRCSMCGSKRQIEAHHIKTFALYPELRTDLDNGITLCNECHRKLNSKEHLYENYFYLIRDLIKDMQAIEIRI